MQCIYTERKDGGGEGERRIGRWRKRKEKERKKQLFFSVPVST